MQREFKINLSPHWPVVFKAFLGFERVDGISLHTVSSTSVRERHTPRDQVSLALKHWAQ